MTQGPGIDRARQIHELNIFHDVAKALTSSLNLDSILQTIMEKVAEYFRPDTWSLLMVDEAKDELYFAIAVGDAAEALKGDIETAARTEAVSVNTWLVRAASRALTGPSGSAGRAPWDANWAPGREPGGRNAHRITGWING